MRVSSRARILALSVATALGLSSCATIEAGRNAEELKQAAFVQRVDTAHVWVTPGDPSADKAYRVLGDLSYSEPFTPDAIDEQGIKDKLKKMGLKKWPDSLDALVDEKSEVSVDGNTVSVSAKAIQYNSSSNRAELHSMNQNMPAFPTGQ